MIAIRHTNPLSFAALHYETSICGGPHGDITRRRGRVTGAYFPSAGVRRR